MRLGRRRGAEYRDRDQWGKKLSDAPAHAVDAAEPVPGQNEPQSPLSAQR
jgi:hypothetical protein